MHINGELCPWPQAGKRDALPPSLQINRDKRALPAARVGECVCARSGGEIHLCGGGIVGGCVVACGGSCV